MASALLSTEGASDQENSETFNIQHVRMLQILNGHNSDVTCCDFNGNENALLITGSSDKSVRIWEWKIGIGYTEASYSPLEGHKYGITCVCVSPHSTMLASSSIDGTTMLWNLNSGFHMHTFVQVSGDAVRVCRFSQSNPILMTAGDNGAICAWDLVTRNLIRTIKQHEGIVQSLAFTPDSMYLLSACTSGSMYFWSIETICDTTCDKVTPLTAIEEAHDLGVLSCDFSNVINTVEKYPIKKIYTLATSGNDEQIKIWNFNVQIPPKSSTPEDFCISSEMNVVLKGHSSAVTCVKYNTTGSILASTSLDKTIRIWNMSTKKCLKALRDHKRQVYCCRFSRNNSMLATGSNDKTIILWNFLGRTTIEPQTVCPLYLTNYWGNLQENAIARLNENESNKIKLFQKIEDVHAGSVNSCDIFKNTLIASCSSDKSIKLYEYSLTTNLFQEVSFSPLFGHTYSVNQVKFSNDGQFLISCSLDGTTIIWDVLTGRQNKPHLTESVLSVRTNCISPDNKLLVTAGDEEKATIYNFESLEQLVVFEGHTEAITSLSFTPDSKVLATSSNNGDFRLWSLEKNLQHLDSFHIQDNAHDLGVQYCEFSENNMPVPNISNHQKRKCYLLVTCGNDSFVKLWKITCSMIEEELQQDTIDLCLWRTLKGHGGNVNCARFSPGNGNIICSVASDRQARIWCPYSGLCLYVLDHDSMVTCCAIASDCSFLVVSCLDKSIWIWGLPEELKYFNVIERTEKKNKPIYEWTSNDVVKWMKSLEINTAINPIVDNEIDGKKLINMNDDEIVSILNLDQSSAFKFMKKINILRQNIKTSNCYENCVEKTQIPAEFLCPITCEIMTDPVICADGYTYEKKAITEWITSGRLTSPMTNENLCNVEMRANNELKSTINAFVNNIGQ